METKKEKISLEIIREIEGDRVFAMAHKVLEKYEDMIEQGKTDTTVTWGGDKLTMEDGDNPTMVCGGKLTIEGGKMKKLEYIFPDWTE